MGLADLFAGGALRERIAELDEALEQTRVELERARGESAQLKAELAERDGALKSAREHQKRSQKKADKLAGTRNNADRKATDLAGRVEELEEELSEFRRAMLAAKDDAATQRVARMEAEKRLASRGATSAGPAPRAPERRERPVDSDMRVARLERLLDENRDSTRALQDRVNRAEKAALDAERRLSSEMGKTEAVLRELQHNLKSERTAYRILQQQFEAQVVRVRSEKKARAAAEPHVTAPVPAATPESPTAPPAAAEPKASPLPQSWGAPGKSSLLAGLGSKSRTPAPVKVKPEPEPEPEAEPVVAAAPEPEADAAAAEPEADAAAAEPEASAPEAEVDDDPAREAAPTDAAPPATE